MSEKVKYFKPDGTEEIVDVKEPEVVFPEPASAPKQEFTFLQLMLAVMIVFWIPLGAILTTILMVANRG